MSDLLELLGQHLRKLKKAGSEEAKAVCPFHRKADGSEEKDPSFYINVYSGLWFCHSCHLSGNLATFLREVGVPPGDIELRYKHYIQEAEAYAPQKRSAMKPIEALNEPLPEGLLTLFEKPPQPLLDEGYPPDLLQRFDVGFDEKHNRVTFPLRDARGKLVGLSGRAIGDERPRYKVYDWEYQDFGLPHRNTNKRALLWNLHAVLIEKLFGQHRGDDFVVVVEGFKAVMRVAQAGISSVVGLLGSHLSEEQAIILERANCPILLMLDNNEAGRHGQIDAAFRLVNVPEVYVVDYDASQPSELPLAAVAPALFSAIPFPQWAAHYATARQSQH